MEPDWIWQQPDWPSFYWNDEEINRQLRAVRLLLGVLIGKTSAIHETADLRFSLDNMLANILASSAIEDERLNAQSVRSSLAKRLGIGEDKPYPITDRSEGVAEMMFDAVTELQRPLTLERLLKWHVSLFPKNPLSIYAIQVGKLRTDELMQVVSGRIDRPIIHFVAPPQDILEHELRHFLVWFNQYQTDANRQLDPLLRAAISHFWFITLHPFDDGNGRITRALTDLALAQADNQSVRLYAMSMSILARRQEYYQILEQCQRGTMDITPWLGWFLDTLKATLEHALATVNQTLKKTRFWQRFQHTNLSMEQKNVLNRLLDGGVKGFISGINATQYQKVAKVSKATATRHLTDLLAKGCLEKLPGGGRSTRYQIAALPLSHERED
ncbi:Fic family protein [Acerihabitans sp. TG2]|uniref:Fic family protein n=1 Tax=Acerihabitans sp. TG2 TaxID=3096008 RepID=UPI002B233EBA|nr:Fic family protein [Acerihabitans sp. TG2]MEA9390024.1 Fic family protein [Acerihabitans sp. TG2]